MSQLVTPPPVKAMAAILSAHRELIGQAARKWEELVGPLDYAGPEMTFNQSEYYREEMGWPQYKRIFAAETLVDPAALVDIKIGCQKIEAEFTSDGRRSVNLDPGYVSPERLVLATGKNAAHRLYLGGGVWGELTLIYESGQYRALPWTYADYASDPVLEVVADLRKKYIEQRRSGLGGNK